MSDVDLAAARSFLTTHGRLLDRLRLLLHLGEAEAPQVLSALDGYQNPDGSYGFGLEPDLRDRTGQPGAALHAFEVFDEIAELTAIRTPSAVKLCDWLADVALPDGGLPFAFPVDDPAGVAPFWCDAEPASSLHITAAVTAPALRLARHDEAVAAHPWLARSTQFCLDRIAARERAGSTLELRYSLTFLDALAATDPTAADHVRRLGAAIPADGTMHVEGGRDDEFLRPLDFSPWPDVPSRELFDPGVVDAELRRLAGRQLDDGGWPPEFDSYSPAAELEWRGYLTVAAIVTLRANAAA